MIFFAHIGQQEYSQRQLAIASGIVFLVLIPLLILIAYLAWRVYLKYVDSNEGSWEYQKPASLLRSFSPTATSETVSSPLSDRSSTDSSLIKRKRSYDKSYRTHEPLAGLPETEFESKAVDPNEPEFEPKSPTSATSPTSSIIYSQPYRSQPDLLTGDTAKPKLSYGSDDYSVPIKKSIAKANVIPAQNPPISKLSAADRARMSSQSSMITDV